MTLDPKPRDRDSRGPGLALVGYRGTGKTTVGKILADRLDLRFLDADLEIEARAGRSILSIFAESGEPVFRDWEEHTLRELVEHHPAAVLASGGGAVLRPSNRRLLLDFGFVVWLHAEPAELAQRLVADLRTGTERPALDERRHDRRDRPGSQRPCAALPGSGRCCHRNSRPHARRNRRADPGPLAPVNR